MANTCLCLDVGNTNIVVGCFDGDKLVHQFRLKTDHDRTSDEYRALFGIMLPEQWRRFNQAVVCSVVPPITNELAGVASVFCDSEPIVVGPGIKTGIKISTNEPNNVGADRIVNCIAANRLFGEQGLVIDFGTATTFDLVGPEGDYCGGAIAPGPKVAMNALVRNTAKLPRIEFAWPKSVVGKSTVTAMQSGIVVGYGCMIEGMVERLSKEFGKFRYVVATGGLGKLFAENIPAIDKHVPQLTLFGIRIVAELNQR